MYQSQSWQRVAKRNRYFAIMLALLLALFVLSGCDQSENTEKTKTEFTQKQSVSSSQNSQSTDNQKSEKSPPSATNSATDATSQSIREKPITEKQFPQSSAQRYSGKDVTVLDASELQLDGANAMVVTFSIPLRS